MGNNLGHVLVTGGAGFIGSHLTTRMLKEGWKVSVIDNLDPYYDISLKRANVRINQVFEGFNFIEGDIRDKDLLNSLPADINLIVHLAAKAGVRPSIANPLEYQEVNVNGTQNLLEFARERSIKQFVFSSSSSVYGINPNVPWSENDRVLQPISPYASTKVSGELLGHVYSHLYDIRFIALRFFTVYGPRQRPDLAIHKFVHKILEGEEIPVFGDGSTRRDYTYVMDIVDGIMRATSYTDSMYEVINLASCRTISLADMIASIEKVFGMRAKINRLPEQAGDVPQTYGDIDKAQKLLGYVPQTSFEVGLTEFKAWIEQNSIFA
ncbi:MAG: NAD-dependent epimerase/dehydratase family protein [Bacteroidota bacterium]